MKRYERRLKEEKLKEAIIVRNKDQAFDAISEGVRFLIETNNKQIIQGWLINAIVDGLKPSVMGADTDSELAALGEITSKRIKLILKLLRDEL
jgi:hypothetical protein